MPMAVQTAMAFPSRKPAASKVGSRPRAAPTAPSAVIGNAMSSIALKPNSHSNTQWILSASQGRIGTPCEDAPVYPSAPGPKVIIITAVVIISTPGIICKPSSTPFLPPSRMAFRKRMKMLFCEPDSTRSSASSSWEAFTTISSISAGQALRQERCIRRVEMIEPQNAPNRPTKAAPTLP